MSSSAPLSLETIPRLILFTGLDCSLMTPSASSCPKPPTAPQALKRRYITKFSGLAIFPDVATLLGGLTVLYPSRPLEVVEVASVMSHGPRST